MIADDSRGARAERVLIIYLGDYVDRGPASCRVVDLLLDGPPADGISQVFLKGNHEDFLLSFLDDPEVGTVWMLNGAEATMASYGVDVEGVLAGDPATAMARLRDAFRAALPARHLAFFRSLRLSHVEGDYFFVHAGIRPGVPLEDQSPHDMMWIRERFLQSTEYHGKMIVHGHTIAWTPERRPNRIGIDTGAFASGVLTALRLEGSKCDFLCTGG